MTPPTRDNAPKILRASCRLCAWTYTGNDALPRFHGHVNREHPAGIDAVPQLMKVSFREAFIAYITALPIGTELTTADLHGKIPDPPSPNHWGPQMAECGRLGLIKPIETQKSELSTTKGSRLLRWKRVAAEGRRAA